MRIFRHVDRLPDDARHAVVAIGNFDGVHLGHRAIIAAARETAREHGAAAAVLTFEPHPRRFFRPDLPPFLLTRLRTRLRLFREAGVDIVHLQRFDAALAAKSAQDFVDEILVARLAARHVVVGYDFVFGRGRTGTPELLTTRLAAHGCATRVLAPIRQEDGTRAVYSSTAIRSALKAGEPRQAASLLGRPFEIEGRVRQGDRRGRQIGFPTANLWLDGYVEPRLGVYAVRVELGGGRHLGVANLGLRPTFGGDKQPRLEVNIFDFAADIYGRLMRVELIDFIRPEQRFASVDALKAQIAIDAADARQRLVAACPSPTPSL
jgi:riboflavin kinase/FMN adenylyltransferase